MDTSARRWLLGIVLGAVALGAAFYFVSQRGTTPVKPSGIVATQAPTAPEAAAQQHYPVPTAPEEATEPLPVLDESDAYVLQALAALAGSGLGDLIVPEHLIQRLVASIDALTRPKVGEPTMALKPVAGSFAVAGPEDARVLDPANYRRYARYAEIASHLDAKATVAAYVHLYPLFQQAYRQLGYPDASFNDRLVQVIDHLLEAPIAKQPVPLAQGSVFYEFADPELEQRSAGHKALMRMGPENAERIKAKLREIRAELVVVSRREASAEAKARD